MSSQTAPHGVRRHLFAVPDVSADAGGTEEPSALAQLSALAERKASGELVCSSSDGEIHVYLQEGRVAWASSTTQRHAFTEHLKQTTGADDEVIDAIVKECTRTRRPFGEALISWKIATAEQVRASLRHQIRMALASAEDAAELRTLFLERERYRYDRALTFALSDVVPRPAAPPAAPEPSREAGRADAGAAPALDPAAELAALSGFAAAAVLSAQGEPVAVLGDRARVGEAAGVAQRLLQEGQRLAIELGAGLCRQLHVEAEDAHLLVYSTRTGTLAPGATGPGALLRVVLVLQDLGNLAFAKQRIEAVAAGLGPGPI